METIIVKEGSVTLTRKESEEYCAYKRQKKVSEIMAAMGRSESVFKSAEDFARLCQHAHRLHQAAMRMTIVDVERLHESFKKSPLRMDCVIGGNGETLAKVKAYEAKKAMRMGAKELTVELAPSHIVNARYGEIRKELKLLRRVARGVILKARIERAFPQATMARLARTCSECGVGYFSLPYYRGCEYLRSELSKGCLLEVSDVDTLVDFKKMTGAGVGRIVTGCAWELYAEWLKEADKIMVESVNEEKKTVPSPPVLPKWTPALTSRLAPVEAATESK